LTAKLEDYFEFARLGADWKTEILAGATTFLTMAYIVFVNPSILAEAGMPFEAVLAATCLSAAFGSILMGAFARYPIALAPGMGLNAYFAYAVVKGMGVAWQTALGAVFLSGLAFFALTALGVRQWIVGAIPREMYAAVIAGIGLFIAFIGLRNAGIVVANPATAVGLGDLRQPGALVAAAGLLGIAVLQAWRVRGAILAGVAATAALGAAAGVVQWKPQSYGLGALQATAFQMDVAGAMKLGLLEIVFVFLFVDLFDNLGTLVGVGKKAGLFDAAGRIPRLNRVLVCDAAATTAGAALGTTTVVSYIESAAGVSAGGRTGVTAIVTGLLFAAALFAAPVVGAIPAAATAPALIVVGSLMLSSVGEIGWNDPAAAVPAFLTLITIPLTFSIANGLAFGIVSHVLLRLLSGRGREVPVAAYLIAALLLARFAWLGAEH
jgi:AGZA family xanthine/uracil permease-like MFS transporter